MVGQSRQGQRPDGHTIIKWGYLHWWQQGGTATFEYIGRQSRVKVRYTETDLVLVAVRDKGSGEWWRYDELRELGQQHGMTVVRRLQELEGLGLSAMDDAVSGWEGSEGVVVQF